MTCPLPLASSAQVYLWHAETGRIDQLPNLPADSDRYRTAITQIATHTSPPRSIVTSVQWAADGSDVLAVGTSTNTVQLWDCKTSTKVRQPPPPALSRLANTYRAILPTAAA